MNSLYVLSSLYFLCFLAYGLYTIRIVVRKNRIEIIDCVCSMFAFVYGFFPMIVYFLEGDGERNLAFYDYSNIGIVNLYLLLLFSIIQFFLLNLSYDNFKKNETVKKMRINMHYKEMFICACITLLIGWVGLLLWTHAYGSINEFILNANAIRSGRGAIYNPYGFMKYVAAVIHLSLYAFFAIFIGDTNLHKWGKIFVLMFMVLAAAGSYIYLLASDSRVQIAFVGLGLLIIAINHYKNVVKMLIFGFLISLILLFLTMNADTFTHYIRFGEWIISDNDTLYSLIREFRFVLMSQMKVMQLWYNDILELKIFDDLVRTFVAWIPTRFIPFDLPLSIWSYNTLNIHGLLGYGTTPCDLLATSIYEFGLIGIVLQPIIFGFLIAIADNIFNRSVMTPQVNVFLAASVGMFVHKVSHHSFESFMTTLFAMFLYFLILFFVERVRIIIITLVQRKDNYY